MSLLSAGLRIDIYVVHEKVKRSESVSCVRLTPLIETGPCSHNKSCKHHSHCVTPAQTLKPSHYRRYARFCTNPLFISSIPPLEDKHSKPEKHLRVTFCALPHYSDGNLRGSYLQKWLIVHKNLSSCKAGIGEIAVSFEKQTIWLTTGSE